MILTFLQKNFLKSVTFFCSATLFILFLLGLVYYIINPSIFGITVYIYVFLIPSYFLLLYIHQRYFKGNFWTFNKSYLTAIQLTFTSITAFILYYSFSIHHTSLFYLSFIILDFIIFYTLVTCIEGMRYYLFYAQEKVSDFFYHIYVESPINKEEFQAKAGKILINKSMTDMLLKKAQIKQLREFVVSKIHEVEYIPYKAEVLRGRYDKELLNKLNVIDIFPHGFWEIIETLNEGNKK